MCISSNDSSSRYAAYLRQPPYLRGMRPCDADQRDASIASLVCRLNKPRTSHVQQYRYEADLHFSCNGCLNCGSLHHVEIPDILPLSRNSPRLEKPQLSKSPKVNLIPLYTLSSCALAQVPAAHKGSSTAHSKYIYRGHLSSCNSPHAL